MQPPVKKQSTQAYKAKEVTNNSLVPKRDKFQHIPKTHAPDDSYVLRRNNLGKVVATYVGPQTNIYVKRSLWVPKILVTNVVGPNSNWGPKTKN